MNVTITKNNLEIIIRDLESSTKQSEKAKAYLQFIKDGLMTIDILNTMIDDLNNTIAVNFRSELVNKIEEKQALINEKKLTQQLRDAEQEIAILRQTNENLINGI